MLLTNDEKGVVRNIIRAAEVNIMLQIGINVTLVMEEDKKAGESDMYVLMGVVARSLGMTMDDYLEGRKLRYVDLRFIAAYFIKSYYPKTSLKSIGRAFGGYDHTSIMNMIEQTKLLLDTKNEQFNLKFSTALKAIEIWQLEER